MITSEIFIPMEMAGAQLIRATLGCARIPNQEIHRDTYLSGIRRGSEIYRHTDKGWIFMWFPADDPVDIERYVNAQVWTGFSHYLRSRGHGKEVTNTMTMEFPAGVIDEQKILLGIIERKLFAHTENFYSGHDPSLPADELFNKGLAWVLEAADRHMSNQLTDLM